MSKGWNHGYTGVLMLIIGIPLTFGYFEYWVWLVLISIWDFIGAIQVVDEIYQWKNKDQYGGFLHNWYVKYFYHKYKWVRDFNHWLDRLKGKEVKDDRVN